MSNTIVLSQRPFLSQILGYLLNAPNYTAACKDVQAKLITDAGGDPSHTQHINAVNNARSSLKGFGLVGDGARRGEWVLTDEGVAVAKGDKPMPTGRGRASKPSPAPTDTPDPAPAPVETPEAPEAVKIERIEDSGAAAVVETPAAETPAPEVSAPATGETAKPRRRLKVAPPVTATAVPEWLMDDEVRGAVIESHECYGAYSPRSAACGECALAGYCRNAMAAQLEVLAKRLATATPATPAPISDAVAKQDAAVAALHDPSLPRTAPNPTAGTMRASFDGKCGISGRDIKKGDTVRYIPGKGVCLADAAAA